MAFIVKFCITKSVNILNIYLFISNFFFPSLIFFLFFLFNYLIGNNLNVYKYMYIPKERKAETSCLLILKKKEI